MTKIFRDNDWRIFRDNDWSIIDCTRKNVGHYKYYSRHDVCSVGVKSWMDWNIRKCDDCSTRIPESIQALITLLIWDS